MGSIEGGEAAERRFDGEGELVGVDMGGSSVPSSGSGELAKERGMKLSGVLVVRLRARNRALGVCLVRATATARWRPRGGSGRRGVHAPGQRSSLGGGGDLPGDVWRPAQRKRGPRGDPERREARRRAGDSRNRGAGWRWKTGT